MEPGRRREAIAFAAIWGLFAALVLRFWWLCDDAFISFRYARNWAAGLGLRYNPGSDPPVEGYSNFLWTAVCSLIERLGLEVTFWAPAISFVCGSLLLYLVFRALRRRFELALAPAVLATAALGCAPPYFIWSTSGLETLPFALLVFVTFERLLLRRDGPAPVAAGLAGLATALMRTEGIAWPVLFGMLAVGQTLRFRKNRLTNWRPLLRYAGVVGIGFAIYFGCRYAYFGQLLANTAYVKMGLTAATLARGLCYVAAFFVTLVTPIVILPGCVVGLTRRWSEAGYPVLAVCLASLGYAVATGGDFMTMWRFLVPGFVVFATLPLGWVLQTLWDRPARGRPVSVALGLAVVLLGLLPAADLHLLPESVRRATHFRSQWEFTSEYARWQRMEANCRAWKRIGLVLKDRFEPGDSCVLGFIGAVGYYSRLHVLDCGGLVTPEVAKRPASGELNAPGHDRFVPFTYFLKDRPAILFVARTPQSPRDVLKKIRRFSQSSAVDGYVVDFLPLPPTDEPSPSRYTVILRRIPEGIEPAAAWEQVTARAEALTNER
ncbi:MAG: hypothetical protein IID40_09430 [Planctomycetes bacterium]|nr:hypothetical protein [Planctomycetota bacterium]